MNKAIPKNNTSGYKGVYFSNGRWEAIVSGVRVGRYSTPEKASLRYEDKAKEAFGEFKRPPEQYNNTPIAKDSNMVYTVGSEGEVMIRYRIEKYAEVGDPPIVSFEITRETEKCFWVAGRKHGTEVRSSKATHPIYSTFGEAKAEYIRQRRLALEDAKYRVRVYQNAVERAEELLAKAPFIQP